MKLYENFFKKRLGERKMENMKPDRGNHFKKTKSGVPNIFYENTDRISSVRLFCVYYGVTPRVLFLKGLNLSKCLEFFNKMDSNQIEDKREVKYFDRDKNQFELDCLFLLFKTKLLIEIEALSENTAWIRISYGREAEALVNEFVKILIQFKKRKPKLNHIHLIIPGKFNALEKASIQISKPKIKIETHYNSDLELLHKDILKKMKQKNESGLFLFHGQPGTGKSTYIRKLIHLVNKTVIFISPRFASSLDSPDFTKFLIDNPNSIFVIEDAENLIVSRDAEDNSAISMILNLTDGLLGEGLGIQFICTFNTHLSRIDKALLRKGRLKALYEFAALSVEKSNHLLESLSLNYKATKPMTLAEIYNLKEEKFDFKGEKRTIGFAA